MATLVSFHAHPDDECIACGGVIRKAADAGHRVVLVVATRGEEGEIPEGQRPARLVLDHPGRGSREAAGGSAPRGAG
jgi:LmbE family N-acetylglucosaminyl deacetylase